MRRLILVLMIALLPLRGWLGEAMATEMATVTATGMVLAPARAAPVSAPAEHPCEGHGEVLSAASASVHPEPTIHIDTADEGLSAHCFACKICHIVAMTVTPVALELHALPALPPRSATPADTSAIRATLPKPPIA